MALSAGSRRSHATVLNAVLDDPDTDGVLGILLPYSGTAFPDVRQVFAEATARHPENPLFLTLFGGAVKAEWVRHGVTREGAGGDGPLRPPPRPGRRNP